jgi:hypothetical protein
MTIVIVLLAGYRDCIPIEAPRASPVAALSASSPKVTPAIWFKVKQATTVAIPDGAPKPRHLHYYRSDPATLGSEGGPHERPPSEG